MIRLRGAQSENLLAHLGAGFTGIAPGATKVGRMADIAVLVCKPSEEEMLLLVDRLYLEHFLGFLRSVAANFGATASSNSPSRA